MKKSILFIILLTSFNVFAEDAILKFELQKLYDHICSETIEPWESEDTTVVTERGVLGVKVIQMDGRTVYLKEKPEFPKNIFRLYVRQNPDGFEFVQIDGVRQFVWRRLYWDPEHGWWPTHPNYGNFSREKRLVAEFLGLIDKSQKNAYGIPIKVSQIIRTHKEETRQKLIEDLKELLKKSGDSWGGTELLQKVYNFEFALGRADIQKKITICNERRKILKEIVDKIPESIVLNKFKPKTYKNKKKAKNTDIKTDPEPNNNSKATPTPDAKKSPKPMWTPTPKPKKDEPEVPGWDF